MRSTHRTALLGIALALVASVTPSCAASDSGDDMSEEELRASTKPFPDSIDQLPADWQQHSKYQFKLAQSYPTTLPTHAALPWKNIDFTKDPDAYVLALRDYAFDGFIHPDDPDADFRGEFNTRAKWFNVPWMHVGPRGREGLHGLTREKDTSPGRLAPTQKTQFQDWGIGFYNDIGGYTIGQVWKNHVKPDATKSQFAEGAVVFKILLSDADPKEVPWLAGAPAWQANIRTSTAFTAPKAIRTVRLAQMDIAVKDSRSKVGWVYTTLVFDPNAPDDKVHGAYGKMMPLGVAWGNDPGVTPGKPLSETKICQKAPDAAKRTLGYGGRLNGPGDNPVSACFSCHQTAEWKPLSGMTPGASDPVDRWFRDLAPGTSFDDGATQLDTSLQVEISLVNFAQYGATADAGTSSAGGSRSFGAEAPTQGWLDALDPNQF